MLKHPTKMKMLPSRQASEPLPQIFRSKPNNKLAYIWTVEKLLELIQLYKELGILWDPDHPKYKGSELTSDAWEKLSEKLGVKVCEVRRKVGNLSVQFHRERRKEEYLRQCGKHFSSPWFPYKLLMFLKKRRNRNKNQAIAGATCETSASDDISSKYQSRARGQQPSVSSLPSTGSLNAEDPNNLPESAEEELGFDNEEVYEPESKRVKVEAIEYMGFESEAPCSSTSRGESRLSNESFELKPILDGTHNFGDNEAFESQTDKSSLVIPKPCTNQPGPSPKTGVRTAPALERNDLFGEYVAAKLRSLKTDAARNRVECLIANILYEASKGTFDDAVTTADITNIIQAYLTSTKDLQFSDSAVTKPSTSML